MLRVLSLALFLVIAIRLMVFRVRALKAKEPADKAGPLCALTINISESSAVLFTAPDDGQELYCSEHYT